MMVRSLGGLHRRRGVGIVMIGLAGFSAALLAGQSKPPPWKSGISWPMPVKVDPGPSGGAPSDAVVLFDGKNLSQWNGADRWKIQDGYAVAGGGITTKQSFGDCQLHLEWASPAEVSGQGQGRGNSGVYLMGIYEVQILDSYENETYFDGQCGSIYKQRPPLVNASRKPGEWQSFDIIWRGPRFDEKGKVTRPAYLTVFHNGVLIQDHFELIGLTNYRQLPVYEPHAEKLPLHIQYHGSPVRFRNIWIRELPDTREDLLAGFRETMQRVARGEPGAAESIQREITP
jgi:hypothetical protein